MTGTIGISDGRAALLRNHISQCAWPTMALAIGLAASGCGDGPTTPKQQDWRLEKISPDSQVFIWGSTLTLSPRVRVTDQQGNPAAGISVRVVSDVEGWVSSVVSDADGIARAPQWKPQYAQVNSLSMLVEEGDGAIEDGDVVTFTATGQCLAQRNIELGVPLVGTLGGVDCQSFCGDYCLTTFKDHFAFENVSDLTVKLQVTSFATVALLDGTSRSLATSNGRDTAGTSHALWAIIPAGRYEVAVSAAFMFDPYEVTIETPAADPGCQLRFIVPGVTTAQTLSSIDCVDQSRRVDSFLVVVLDGKTSTVSMSSSGLETVLKVVRTGYADYTTPPPVTTSTGRPGMPAALTASCGTDKQCIFSVVASTKSPAATGNYTLSVQPR